MNELFRSNLIEIYSHVKFSIILDLAALLDARLMFITSI